MGISSGAAASPRTPDGMQAVGPRQMPDRVGQGPILSRMNIKRIAIAKARRVIKRSLTYDRLDGPLRFLATEIIDSPQTPTRVNPFALDNPSEATAPPKALPPHIGKLCRNGAPVYYTFPPHAAYREASDWHDLV